MTGNMWIYCPYCGVPQSEEYELMRLLRDEVFVLSCRECKKDCALILYDDIRPSTPLLNSVYDNKQNLIRRQQNEVLQL